MQIDFALFHRVAKYQWLTLLCQNAFIQKGTIFVDLQIVGKLIKSVGRDQQ